MSESASIPHVYPAIFNDDRDQAFPLGMAQHLLQRPAVLNDVEIVETHAVSFIVLTGLGSVGSAALSKNRDVFCHRSPSTLIIMSDMGHPSYFSSGSRLWTRREFHRLIGFHGLAWAAKASQDVEAPKRSRLALAKDPDRRRALSGVLAQVGIEDLRGKEVLLKASYNSPDEFPATTHPDTLAAVVKYLREKNCGRIVLLERSGMGKTRDVWERLGIPDLAAKLHLTLLPLDEMSGSEWRHEAMPGSAWSRGVEVPALLRPDSAVVQISNLKTHRFGGHFSASLKNSIGLIAKYSPTEPRYNYMAELHASPQQRELIAEVNQLYAPLLVVVDAMEVFVRGGPESGELASPNVILSSPDRVAIDAAGVALLRYSGASLPVTRGRVFDQDQLKRAVELGLGVKSADEIEFLTTDGESGRVARLLKTILQQEKKAERNP